MRQTIAVFAFLTFAAAATLTPSPAGAADYTLTIKDHKFSPSEIEAPANMRVIIAVINNDITPEEFDSTDLKAEKVVAGNSKGTVRIGPLKPGRYKFIGEFHEDTAKGTVVVE
jgi:hypothetical protein